MPTIHRRPPPAQPPEPPDRLDVELSQVRRRLADPRDRRPVRARAGQILAILMRHADGVTVDGSDADAVELLESRKLARAYPLPGGQLLRVVPATPSGGRAER